MSTITIGLLTRVGNEDSGAILEIHTGNEQQFLDIWENERTSVVLTREVQLGGNLAELLETLEAFGENMELFGADVLTLLKSACLMGQENHDTKLDKGYS